jgi:hypothetical protein
MPIVVRLQQRQTELGVLRGEQPTRKTRERRETDRPQNAPGIHVLDPLIDLPAPRPDLIEPLRFQSVLVAPWISDGVTASG